MKKLLNISATSLSSDIISSEDSARLPIFFFSIKVILDLVFILSVKKGFTVFQNILLSVM